jgi:hypothetical protein
VVSITHTPVGGRVLRVTRIDTYGQVVTGTCGKIVSGGWATVTLTDNVTTQSRYNIRTGGPVACLPVRSRPLLNYVDVVIDFVRVDPDLVGLLTAARAVVDGSGASVGFAGDTDTYAGGSVAFELWTGIAGGCAATGSPLYGYLLLPWLVGGVNGAVTHNVGAASFKVSATTVARHRWGSGPYNVVANGAGAAVPLLSPVPSTRHRHWQLTTVPPPAAVAGCQTL